MRARKRMKTAYAVRAWNDMSNRQLDYKMCRNMPEMLLTVARFARKYVYIRVEKRVVVIGCRTPGRSTQSGSLRL